MIDSSSIVRSLCLSPSPNLESDRLLGMAWCSSDRLGALRVSGKRRDEGLRPHIGTTSPLGRGPFHAADDAVLCARTLDSHGASARCRSLSRPGAHRHAGERGARRPEPDAAWARWLVGVWRSSSISRSSIDTRNDTILPCTSGPDLMRCRVCASRASFHQFIAPTTEQCSYAIPRSRKGEDDGFRFLSKGLRSHGAFLSARRAARLAVCIVYIE